MDAVFAALAEHLTPQHIPSGREPWIHPFEILTIGGDDLLLIVPGTRALDIALALGLRFEERLNHPASPETRSAAALGDRYVGEQSERARQFRAYEPRIGLSAGVVIAQENAPIFFLRDLADELLESAKRAGRKRGIGMVDFMVMKSITMVADKIAGFRKVALGDDDEEKLSPDSRRLTGRPYTWHEFAGLLETAGALRAAGMPRSQLYRLRQVLADSRDSGILAGSLEYLTTRVRLRHHLASVVLEHVERNWRGLGSAENVAPSGAPPWLRRRQGWETIWPDLVEIYDILK
jgi:CRISPR-associated protein Cmr2